jgi:hypothetical protein
VHEFASDVSPEGGPRFACSPYVTKSLHHLRVPSQLSRNSCHGGTYKRPFSGGFDRSDARLEGWLPRPEPPLRSYVRLVTVRRFGSSPPSQQPIGALCSSHVNSSLSAPSPRACTSRPQALRTPTRFPAGAREQAAATSARAQRRHPQVSSPSNSLWFSTITGLSVTVQVLPAMGSRRLRGSRAVR